MSQFSFTNNPSDNPYELLTEVTDALNAMTMIFISDGALELTARATSGVYQVLEGCKETLETVEQMVKELICDPVAFASRKSMDFANGEYLRGVREGQGNLLKAIEKNDPILGRAVRTALAGIGAKSSSTDRDGSV